MQVVDRLINRYNRGYNPAGPNTKAKEVAVGITAIGLGFVALIGAFNKSLPGDEGTSGTQTVPGNRQSVEWVVSDHVDDIENCNLNAVVDEVMQDPRNEGEIVDTIAVGDVVLPETC